MSLLFYHTNIYQILKLTRMGSEASE